MAAPAKGRRHNCQTSAVPQSFTHKRCPNSAICFIQSNSVAQTELLLICVTVDLQPSARQNQIRVHCAARTRHQISRIWVLNHLRSWKEKNKCGRGVLPKLVSFVFVPNAHKDCPANVCGPSLRGEPRFARTDLLKRRCSITVLTPLSPRCAAFVKRLSWTLFVCQALQHSASTEYTGEYSTNPNFTVHKRPTYQQPSAPSVLISVFLTPCLEIAEERNCSREFVFHCGTKSPATK